jgi:hypothetical protein
MAATDYDIVTGWMNAYLTKKKKSNSKTMSQDRRIITDNEIIGLFEFYLRKWYENKGEETVVIKDSNGNKIFEATLYDKEDETEEKE